MHDPSPMGYSMSGLRHDHVLEPFYEGPGCCGAHDERKRNNPGGALQRGFNLVFAGRSERNLASHHAQAIAGRPACDRLAMSRRDGVATAALAGNLWLTRANTKSNRPNH
jgi:hypothetical protein